MDRTQDTAAFLLVRIDDWGNVLKTFGVGVDSWGVNQGRFAIYDFGGGVGGAAQPRLTIADDGNVTFDGSVTGSQFFQTSARRFKQNIRPLEDPLAAVQRLRGVHFDWKANLSPSLGFLAEEVGEVLPETVSRNTLSGPVFGLNYDGLIALELEALRSQAEQLATLKSKREELVRLLEQLKQANHNAAVGRK